jgi:DNA-binding transcriptional MerR regulator
MGTLRMSDLVAATGATPRAVRFYVERGLLPKAEGRGTGLIYTEEHVLRLRAVRHFRAQRLTVAQIRARLASLSPAELARLGAPPSPSGASPPATSGTATSKTQPAPSSSGDAARSWPAERWERLALLPGLELHVRADAGPLVRRLAEEIQSRYSTASG